MSLMSWMTALCMSLAVSVVSAAERLAVGDVPAPLAPWVSWALDGVPDRDCPQLFNSDQRYCVWSGPLHISVQARGGSFDVDLAIHARSWVALPGGDGQWPQAVTVDGSAALVIAQAGRPAVELQAGRHQLSGRFEWPVLPEILQVPPQLGIVELNIEGAPRVRISAASGGQLWLKLKADAVNEGDRVESRVFRQLVDELPMTVETVLELDVAGRAREWRTAGMLLDGAVPMQLSSPLPARLEADGELRLQLQPGRWRIELRSRQPTATTRLTPPAAAAPWPEQEIWAFAARNALRLVEVRGGTVVDPLQTNAPAAWRGLPTWRMTRSDALEFVEQRRGDPQPQPDQLNLERDLWLDFDGGGYTVHDRLSGQMTRQWRLDASPALQLGRVSLNGEAQFITDAGDQTRGVEVRRGALDLEADSRLAPGRLPAVGWAVDVNQLSTRLHLPPGWRLWSARGADNVPDTWLKRWTLLDLFLVLIVTIAVARLMGYRWAALTLLTLALTWHEAGAPRQIWLHLLAAQALLGVLPANPLRRVVAAYRNLTLGVMAVLCVGFMISQVRSGLFPQLARPYEVVGVPATAAMGAPMQAPAPAQSLASAALDGGVAMMNSAGDEARQRVDAGVKSGVSSAVPAAQVDIDAHATIQTGPGLPAWQWHTVALSWNGPVKHAQSLHLYLISPRVNLALACARVVLLAALMMMFLRDAWQGSRLWLSAQRGALGMLFVALACSALTPRTAQAALPDSALLQELTQRLTRAPDCLPSCAAVPRLRAELREDVLRLTLEVHAARAVAVPLPGGAEQWVPRTVVVDGEDQRSLFRDEAGVLWLALTEGRHRVDVEGAVPADASFQLPLPLPPQHLEVALAGWTLNGQRVDGGAESQLIFTRIAAREGGAEQSLEPRTLPAFFRVERVLRLGLVWRVETRVTRLTPPDSAAALAIPLLPGESVTSPATQVLDGRVLVNMAASDSEMLWTSVLTQSTPLVLTAAASHDWVETWRADIAPLWHAELGGLAVVHHQSEQGQWLPTWQPWPGEQVTLTLTRPRGVEGQSLTIDNSRLAARPAQRASDFTLEFGLRSSKGGQHVMTLPAGASLTKVSIDGAPQPIRQEGETLTLPVVPGTQQFTINWQSSDATATLYRLPHWSLGTPSVNASLAVSLPQDRWVLFAGGPRLGPAVLFWGVLLVWCLVALALGRSRITPLSTTQWLLLVIGLTQIEVVFALLVIAWLFALALRERVGDKLSHFAFNALQIMLALLTLLALGMLFHAIEQGLLGQPDMQIAGNGSAGSELKWFQDRVTDAHPQAWVLSVSLWFYRGLMLAWALWLALALLDWLRWGWRAFSMHGLWRSASPPAAHANVSASSSPTPPADE